MKLIRITAIIAGLAFVTFPALAAAQAGQDAQSAQPAATSSTIPADQQATKEQIERFFEVARLRKQMEGIMNMMPGVIEQAFKSEIKNVNAKLPADKQLMPEDQAALTKIMNKYMHEAQTMYPVDDMIADAVPVYQRHISRSDIEAIIAFYSSSTGQRLLDEQPSIMSEYMAVVMTHMQGRSKRLTDEMQAEIQNAVKPVASHSGKTTKKTQ